MAVEHARDSFPGVGDTSFNPKHAVAWVEGKPSATQALYVNDIFQQLLQSAARPRQSSGNACVKLCGFVELCAKSQCMPLSHVAFAEQTAWELFNFFIRWNEQDQHRSMRLVLDCLGLSVSKNPDPEVGRLIKARVLTEAMSMMTLQSTRPSVKSAMITFDYFLQKRILHLSELLEIYRHVHHLPKTQAATCSTFDEKIHLADGDLFINKIFHWMESHNVWPVAGKLLVTLFTSPWDESQPTGYSPDSWHRFLRGGLQGNVDLLEAFKLYTFVPLFKADRSRALVYLDYASSLQTLASKSNDELDIDSVLWLAALEAGKKVGVVDEVDSGTNETPHSFPDASAESSGGTPGPAQGAQLHAGVLEDILCHYSQEVRSSAVSILLASPSTTKPYTALALDLLQKHLPAYHADADGKFRYDVLGHSRNMIRRILGAIGSLHRDHGRSLKKAQKSVATKSSDKRGDQTQKAESTESTTATNSTSLLQRHEAFVRWYLEFLKHELVPTASYQRHITALKATALAFTSGLLLGGDGGKPDPARTFSLVDATWIRAVLDLMMDPFDDVRETAAYLLRQLSSSKNLIATEDISDSLHTSIPEFCQRSSELAGKTARADHSDGVARSYELLCEWTESRDEKLKITERLLADLENKLSAAEHDLAGAVLEAPVHGNFASLGYIWASLCRSKYTPIELGALNVIQRRAISCCERIWHTVRHVLCDDSPEGHLPEELEDVEGLGTKDLLSYSFRAIHESSNLLQTIANNARFEGASDLLTPGQSNFDAIGQLTFDELSNLRHRGAFTTVSQTFATCCQLVRYYPSLPTGEESMLHRWYKGTLACIYNQASTTRRSAGIPALMIGVLSANADNPSLPTVIHKLRGIAQTPARIAETDGSNLPQVHALNCINNIFKSSSLSKKAEAHLTDCFELATDSLKSEVWAIRNCGLLLLRSLIDCLFGTNEGKSAMEAGWDGRSTKIAWHKYEALPAVLVSLLEMGQHTTDSQQAMATAEAVFPALDIVRRAGPPEHFKGRLYDVIVRYLGSHIWHVREIAARTLCSFLLEPDWTELTRTLLEGSTGSANKLHGALLTFKFLLERLQEVMENQLLENYPDPLLEILEQVRRTGGSFNTCSEVRAVYYEIVRFVNQLGGSTKHASQRHFLHPNSGILDTAQPGTGGLSSSALSRSKQGQALAEYELQQRMHPGDPGAEDPRTLSFQVTLDADVNVACDMLETLAQASGPTRRDHHAITHLLDVSVATCLDTEAQQPRVLALEILAQQLDLALEDDSEDSSLQMVLPSEQDLFALWSDLQRKPMNPKLADAIIRASGPILAAVVARRDRPDPRIPGARVRDPILAAALAREFPPSNLLDPDVDGWLRSWGVMMGEAVQDDKGFDTRMAAVLALGSLSSQVGPAIRAREFGVENSRPPHLAWLLALYDALNDDDDEIRAAAAAAARPLLGRSLMPLEAGARLPLWLAARFRETFEFRRHAVCRVAGFPYPAASEPLIPLLDAWTPAADQLAAALVFDGALFVVEEQNLYVDEVREARRWRDVLALLLPAFDRDEHDDDTDDEPDSPYATVEALQRWTCDGLVALTKLAAEGSGGGGDDGPLGWTSKPQVFAICARVLTAGAALAKRGAGCPLPVGAPVGRLLRGFWEAGRKTRVHGLLLAICET